MKLMFFPDPESSLLMASYDDKKACVWDLTIKKQVRQLSEAHTDIVSTFATTNDKAYLITGGRDGIIAFWKVASGFEFLNKYDVGEEIGSLVYLSLKTSFGMKSFLLVGGTLGVIKVFDIGKQKFKAINDDTPSNHEVTHLFISQNTQSLFALNMDQNLINFEISHPKKKLKV